MASTSGTAANVLALMQAIRDFATAYGWTNDHDASDRLHLHKGTLYVSFRWAASNPTNVGIFHALGFVNSGTDPGNHTDDSGQGVISGVDATIATGRHAPLINGSMTYWIFEDTSYLYVVVKTATNDYRHFGWGAVDEVGDDWTGGTFAYGWRWNSGSSDFDLLAVRTDSAMLLDALGTELAFAASVHLEGIPNQAAGKWGVVGDLSSAGTDRGSSARTKIVGGFRGGIGRQHPWSSQNQAGLVPLYSIPILAKVNSDTDLYLLGTMPGVRGVDLSFFAAEDSIVIGGQTWRFFPSKARGAYDGVTQTTAKQGIAYLVVP